MPAITFAFTRDNTGIAGVVRPIRASSDYVVPELDLASLARVQTSSVLAPAAVFNSGWIDRYDDAYVTRLRALSFSDQAGTLYVEQSNDQVAVTALASPATTANANVDTGWLTLTQRYYRVRYVNGSVSQAVFMLYLTTDVPRAGLHPGTGVLIDRSGTIATGNTSQQLAPANPSRRYLFIQNLSTAALWINFTSVATLSLPSIQLMAWGNGVLSQFVMESSYVSNEVVNVIGGTGGQAFSAKEGV